MSARITTRTPWIPPWASNPISSSYATSRAWFADIRFSRRSSIQRTGRPSSQGGEGHEDVLGVELAAHAEAAAHVHLGEAERPGRQAEDRREDAAVNVNALGGAEEVELAAAGRGRHRQRARASRARPRSGAGAEALAQHQRGAGQRGIGVAHAHPDDRDVVRIGAGEEARRARGERGVHRRRDRERRVLHLHRLEGVLGEIAAIGDDEGDGLSDIANDVAGDGRLQVPLSFRRGRGRDWE